MQTERGTHTHTHTNFDSKRIKRSLYFYDYCDRNLKKLFLCFLAASGVTGEPPKRRVDISGELAKRREQKDKEIALRERELALTEQKLKLDQQKFEAGEQERRDLLKFLMDKYKT